MSLNADTLRLLEKIDQRISNIEYTFNKQIMRINALERNLNKIPPQTVSKLSAHTHPYALFGHLHDVTEVPIVLDEAYPTNWNTDTTHSPSRNALFDKIDIIDDQLQFFNGTFLEKFRALVTSDGAIITLSLDEASGGADLTMVFSSGQAVLNTDPTPVTIVLTAGTDAAPQANYVYILESAGSLGKDTAAWPAAEHIKIAYCLVPSAGFVQTNNVYVNNNWNDGTDSSVPQGHMSHMAQRSRYFGAKYFSGVDPAGVDDYLTIAVGNVEFKSGAGVVWQMHSHTFGAFDTSGGDLVLVKNWSGDAYHDITDLADIVDDSTGTSLNNKWCTLVVWGVANKTGELDYIIINLPSGSYATQAFATQDANNYTDFLIPREFSIDSATGFLIAAIVVKVAATWSFGSTKDLRGINTAFAVAGGTGSGITDHGSLTGIADDDHTQYMLDSVFGTITNAPDIDQDLLTTSSPAFVSPTVSTRITPAAAGGASVGVATNEFLGIYLSEDAGSAIFLGLDQDVRIHYDAVSSITRFDNATNQMVTDASTHYWDATGLFLWRDTDDASVALMTLDTSARTLQIFTNADPGIVTIGGDGADDASLVLPYLTGIPGTVANGAIWMEADGLHIYYNAAEKLVAGV